MNLVVKSAENCVFKHLKVLAGEPAEQQTGGNGDATATDTFHKETNDSAGGVVPKFLKFLLTLHI